MVAIRQDDAERRAELAENLDSDLAEAFGVDIESDDLDEIEDFIDFAESAKECELAAAYYICEIVGKSYAEAVSDMTSSHRCNDVYVTTDPKELFKYFTDEIPTHLQFYFDWKLFLSDMQSSGDLTEFDFNGSTYYTESIKLCL